MTKDIIAGLPFSQAYLRPNLPLQDDVRFRVRLSGLFGQLRLEHTDVADSLKREGGIEVRVGYNSYLWDAFFKDAPLVEVLDAIGLIARFLKPDRTLVERAWRQGIAKILKEQSMAYQLDEAGAVRRLVDGAFERTKVAAVAGLGKARYRTALDYFNQAMSGLEQEPPDTAAMVRNVFLANEEIFKLMFPAADRLVAGNARNHLKPETLVSTQPAITASQEMANSFARWIGACQQYRHAPGEIHDGDESPAAPPLDLAIVMMSAGATFVRWLIAMDGAATQSL